MVPTPRLTTAPTTASRRSQLPYYRRLASLDEKFLPVLCTTLDAPPHNLDRVPPRHAAVDVVVDPGRVVRKVFEDREG
jgi:hypothetical protein